MESRRLKSQRAQHVATSFRRVRGLILAIAFWQFVTASVLAQTTNASNDRPWEFQWRLNANVKYDDNVFHLSAAQRLKKESGDSGTALSNRFLDMESVDDITFPLSLGFEATRAQGLFSYPLSLSVAVAYHPFMKNSRRSHVKIDVITEQYVSRRGRFKFQAEYVPSLFRKNYLADVLDLTGRVDTWDRVYKPGIYREWDLALEYKHNFSGPLRWLDGTFLVGYRERSFDAPFTGRDQRALRAGGQLGLALTKRWSAGVGYVYEASKSPVTEEVMILDEPVFRLDFNNDLDIADNNRRTVQRVDRSRRQHVLGASTKAEVLKDLELSFGFEFLRRDYTSNEPLDPGYRGRTDLRNTFTLGGDYQIFRGCHIRAGYEFAKQTVSALDDPEFQDETTDYEVSVYNLGIRWQL